jgi:hypothetical protein
VASFQQGTGGYRAAVDTYLAQGSVGANNSRASELSVDGDDPNGSGLDTQALLRFDDIFGTGAGQVPPGSVIRSAALELSSTNLGAGATLHRMLEDWSDGEGWSAFGGDGVQAGLEAAAADATASGTVDAVRVDVTRSVAAWSADPCTNFGWALLPLGNDGWDFYAAEGATPPRLTVDYALGRELRLVRVGDSWDYFKGTSVPPPEWKDPGFAPGAGWLSGRTGIGYGDADDATVLGDMRGNYASIYCRREFRVEDPDPAVRLVLRIDYDDGFVAYLNGTEAARSPNAGAPGTPIGPGNLPAPRDAGVPEEFVIDAALLVAGENLLAIEVHNTTVDSSDFSFIPELAEGAVLVDDGVEWSFLPGSLPLPPDWNGTQFDDAGWRQGPTAIGYGDGDDRTEIVDMQGNFLALFCRRDFEVADPGRFPEYILTVVCDDGAVVYVNGVEVGRTNMQAGPVTASTPASSSVEPGATSFRVPPGRLRAGRNVLAASVHNSSVDSSDLSFSAVLAPLLAPTGAVACGAAFQRGDITGDGTRNLPDAVSLLNHLFLGGEAPACADAADVDDDGILRLTDAVSLLNYLFLGGVAPSAPGAECGADPTPDALADCSTAACGG